MTNLVLKLPAIIIDQFLPNNQAIYLTKVKVRDIYERYDEKFIIDFYQRVKDGPDKGYQRKLNPLNVNKLENFVLKEVHNPLMPTSILVSGRDDITYKNGNIELVAPLYIIDGQHRVQAWVKIMKEPSLRNKWGDYELPMVVLSNFKRLNEMEQFYIVNSRQKRITTDLALRFIVELSKDESTEGLIKPSDIWKAHATNVADLVNENDFDQKNVWYEKIELPSDSDSIKKTRIISLNAFVKSLRYFISGKNAFFKVESGADLDKFAKFFIKYWGFIKNIESYKPAFDHPRDYNLQRAIGINTFNIVLAKEMERTDDYNQAISSAVKSIRKASTQDFALPFWMKKQKKQTKNSGKYAGAFSSESGYQKLAMSILFNDGRLMI